METFELPDQAFDWAVSAAPHAIIGVTPLGGGMTNTKWVLTLAEGGPLVLRWANPTRWGSVGREQKRGAGEQLAG